MLNCILYQGYDVVLNSVFRIAPKKHAEGEPEQ